MKNKFYIILAGFLASSSSLYAYPGKQEFKVSFDDGYTKFINDGNKIIILEVIKPSAMSNSEKVNCVKKSINDGAVVVGSYNVKFEKNYGIVNGKKFSYVEKKTDLFPYYDICN